MHRLLLLAAPAVPLLLLTLPVEAQAVRSEPAILMSIVKPLLVLLVFGGWAWVVEKLDKDAAYYYLPRIWWNLGQIGAGLLALAAMLLIPIFFVGWPLGVLILAAGIIAYVYVRNPQVPENKRWTFDPKTWVSEKIEQRKHDAAVKEATVHLRDHKGAEVQPPGPDDPRFEAWQLLEKVLAHAAPRGAEQVDLAVAENKAQLLYRIDGVKYPGDAPEPAQAATMIDLLKEVAGLDVDDRRKRQRGEASAQVDDAGKVTLEVETAGSTRGLQLLLRLDPRQGLDRPVKELGLLEPQRQQLLAAIDDDDRDRVVLVSGPAKSGVSVTLHSLLQQHDPYTSSVVTLQQDRFFEIDGVNHNYVDDPAPAKRLEQLGSLLRADPDVMMLDRLDDAATVELIAKSAEDIRFYVPIKADDALTAVRKWVKSAGSTRLGAQSLRAAVNQRLVRRLCSVCRVAYKPDASALKKLNLPADKVSQLYRASGSITNDKGEKQPCPRCHGMAYRGRTAIFEIIVMDAQARALLASGELDRLRAHLRKQKMLYLQEAALAKAADGATDIKEIQRVLGESEK
jgi:type II secretory ATPase GspE/PulE/Tfp pilus assembly ATPase PilB-like protein